jgi:hypothetical protein
MLTSTLMALEKASDGETITRPEVFRDWDENLSENNWHYFQAISASAYYDLKTHAAIVESFMTLSNAFKDLTKQETVDQWFDEDVKELLHQHKSHSSRIQRARRAKSTWKTRPDPSAKDDRVSEATDDGGIIAQRLKRNLCGVTSALAGLKIEDTDIIPIHVPRLTAVCASSCASSDDEEAGQSQQALCSETAE